VAKLRLAGQFCVTKLLYHEFICGEVLREKAESISLMWRYSVVKVLIKVAYSIIRVIPMPWVVR
jgi:hypothetical protein